jgi:hypothetical protein
MTSMLLVPSQRTVTVIFVLHTGLGSVVEIFKITDPS